MPNSNSIRDDRMTGKQKIGGISKFVYYNIIIEF